MKKLQTKRMNRIAETLATKPLRPAVVQRAFDLFRRAGELPDQQRIADAVCRRALGGRYLQGPSGDPTAPDFESLISITVSGHEPKDAGPPTVRENVFHEAVFGNLLIQRAARLVLRREVGRGGDPADPKFLADRTLPDHAGVSMHLLGYPERLAKPPYVAQAKRLFARYASLRGRIDYADPAWFEPIGRAIGAFRETGELPDDELARECVLADGELFGLVRHQLGQGDAELMAAFDAAARTKGGIRTEAIAKLQQLVRAGRLFDAG